MHFFQSVPDFNPRSREESDKFRVDCQAPKIYFNPRSREGSDEKLPERPHHYRYFNPRSREGSDIARRYDKVVEYLFQSTLPRGERQYKIIRR